MIHMACGRLRWSVLPAVLPIVAAGLPAIVGCGSEATQPGPSHEEPVGTSQQALVGVPEDGYPSYDEMAGIVAMNRARSDPNNPSAGTASDCSTERDPQPPLQYDHDAGQAARFHCTHLIVNDGGLSHDSFCTLRSDLETTGCDGSADCSCEQGTECWSCDLLGGCGTGYSGRMSIFGFTGSPASECGAAGYGNLWGAVGGWVTEGPCNSPTEGHRNSVTSANANVAGTGSASGSSGCWSTYQFADFGRIDGLAIPRIASAIHRPETGSSGTAFSFYANYYDAAGDPTALSVVIDGACQPMAVEIGQAGNRTYLADATFGADGCHEYWFLATDAGGARATYPEQGAYQLAVGSGTCTGGYYTSSRTPADCEDQPCEPAEICGNGVDDDCNGVADDGCGQGGGSVGGSGTGASSVGGSGGEACAAAGSCGLGDVVPEDDEDEGGCGCRIDGPRPTGGPIAYGVIVAAAWAVLRRRGRRSDRGAGRRDASRTARFAGP